jgi:mannosyltransferase
MQPTAVNESAGFPPLQTRPAGWTHCLTLVLLFGAGTLLRFHCAACKPFWFDECFSVEVARLDCRNFLHLMWWREANMSLYYVLLRFWLPFGGSPFSIRSLSVLVSAATLPAVHWVTKLLYDRRVALIATALLAVNAYSVRFAQEARSYSLFLLLATLSSGFLISWLRGTRLALRSQSATSNLQAWRLSGYVLTTVLAVYAHFYALLLIPVEWFAVSRISPYMDAKTQAAILQRTWKIIALAVLPLLIFVAKTGAGPIRWIQRPGLQDLAEFFKHFAGGNNWVLPTIFLVACAAAIAPLGRRVLWSRTQSWEVWRCQFLLLWLLFPIALTVLLSFARPVFLARYMIFCLPPLLILAAVGLAHLNRWARPVAVSIVLVLGLQGTAFVYSHDFDTERDASVAASNFILDHSEPGDAIIFHIAETRVPYEFIRSLRADTNTDRANFTAALGPEIVFPRHGPELDYRDFTGKPTPDLARNAASGSPRLWVMLMNNGPEVNPDPTTKMLSQVLPETLPKLQRWQFPRVEVRLYSRQ